ncbi:uncharacterized protein AB9W97_010435 [Spinachia spinachia]
MSGAEFILVTALLALALFISVCVNVVLLVKRRPGFCRDADKCWLPHICGTESPSENGGHLFHNLNVAEQQDNPWLQENPIYGNINLDQRDSVDACHEMMAAQHAGDHAKNPSQPDLNYASLDLKMAKKRGKKSKAPHQQSPAQGRSHLGDEAPARLTPPANAFLEAEADTDAHLPSRDTGLSHSSIYLNSQQIARETEEMERAAGGSAEWEDLGCVGTGKREDRRSARWKGEPGMRGEGT